MLARRRSILDQLTSCGIIFLYLPMIIPHVSFQVPDGEFAPYKDLPEGELRPRDGYHPHPMPQAGSDGMETSKLVFLTLSAMPPLPAA